VKSCSFYEVVQLFPVSKNPAVRSGVLSGQDRPNVTLRPHLRPSRKSFFRRTLSGPQRHQASPPPGRMLLFKQLRRTALAPLCTSPRPDLGIPFAEAQVTWTVFSLVPVNSSLFFSASIQITLG